MNARRWYAPTVLGLLACGGLVFFAGSRVWMSGRVRADGLPSDLVTVTGSAAEPLVPALGLVIGAAALAVLATRGRLRRLVGVLTVVAATAVAVISATDGGALADAFDAAVRQSTAFTGANSPADVDRSLWPWVVRVTAIVAAALGLLTVRCARIWPSMSGRYDAPGTATTHVVDVSRDDGADVWKALDDGQDPTL